MTGAELKTFRHFLEQQLPEGTAHLSEADIAEIRQLLDMVGHPAAAAPLIAEITALLAARDSASAARLCDGSIGVRFESAKEARSFLRQFRTLLTSGPPRGRRRTVESGPREMTQ